MEQKEKVIKLSFNGKRYELKLNLFKVISENQDTKQLKRDYDQQGNLKQYIEITKNKQCESKESLNLGQIIKENDKSQPQFAHSVKKQEDNKKIPILNHQNRSQKLNDKKLDNQRSGSAKILSKPLLNYNQNNPGTKEQKQNIKNPNFFLIQRPRSKNIENKQIADLQSIQQNDQTQNTWVQRYSSLQPIIKVSWYRYNQNILYSDIDLLDNDNFWLPNTILDAMANMHNQKLYKQYFDKSIKEPTLIHVFPTVVYDEIERQRTYKLQNKPYIDCFVYTQELKFLKKVISQIYTKFYFLVSNKNHYFLIEVLLQEEIINIYDSMIQRNNHQQKIIKENIQNILIKYDIQIQFKTIDIYPYPRQKDSSNCGCFALYYLKQLLVGNKLRNLQEPDLDTQKFRREIKNILNPKIRIRQEANICSG